MHGNSEALRIWISGSPVDVWEHPEASFSWTPNGIELYAHREQWESVFNALVLLGDCDPRGRRRVTLVGVRPARALWSLAPEQGHADGFLELHAQRLRRSTATARKSGSVR
jgi:hypothetical protein